MTDGIPTREELEKWVQQRDWIQEELADFGEFLDESWRERYEEKLEELKERLEPWVDRAGQLPPADSKFQSQTPNQADILDWYNSWQYASAMIDLSLKNPSSDPRQQEELREFANTYFALGALLKPYIEWDPEAGKYTKLKDINNLPQGEPFWDRVKRLLKLKNRGFAVAAAGAAIVAGVAAAIALSGGGENAVPTDLLREQDQAAEPAGSDDQSAVEETQDEETATVSLPKALLGKDWPVTTTISWDQGRSDCEFQDFTDTSYTWRISGPNERARVTITQHSTGQTLKSIVKTAGSSVKTAEAVAESGALIVKGSSILLGRAANDFETIRNGRILLRGKRARATGDYIHLCPGIGKAFGTIGFSFQDERMSDLLIELRTRLFRRG